MVDRVKHAWLGIICFLTALLYLIDVFFPTGVVFTTYNILAAVLVIMAILQVRRANQIAAVLLLCIGSIIFLYSDVAPRDIIPAFGENVQLITLFIVVPFIGVVISVGGYLTALKAAVQKWENNYKARPYAFGSILIYMMGIILNLGAMPITYRIAAESFASFHAKKMGLVLLRAFAFCMFWSPYFVNVGIVIVVFDVSWIQFGWIGLLLAVIYLGISWLFFRYIRMPDDTLNETGRQEDPFWRKGEVARKLYALAGWVGALLTLSFVLDYVLAVTMLTVVSVLALIFPLLWSVAIGHFREYVYSIVQMVRHSFERLKNEIVIFISAGYFGVAVTHTDFGTFVSNQLLHYSSGSVYVLSILIVISMIGLAMVGVHPVIVLIGVGGALSPSLFGVSPEFLAVLLLVAWTLSTIVSPFTGSVMMASNLMNVSPWTIAKQNAVFVCVLVLVLPLVLYALWRVGVV